MPVRLQSGATANKFRCATRSPYFMIPKPASRLSSRATSTLIAGSSMFAVTRCSVQRQFKPFSIKSRDILAMALASAVRAKRKVRSECFIGNLQPEWGNRLRLSACWLDANVNLLFDARK